MLSSNDQKKVIRRLVLDNPNDMMLGEVVRQYIKELDQSDNGVRHFADGFHEGDWKRD